MAARASAIAFLSFLRAFKVSLRALTAALWSASCRSNRCVSAWIILSDFFILEVSLLLCDDNQKPINYILSRTKLLNNMDLFSCEIESLSRTLSFFTLTYLRLERDKQFWTCIQRKLLVLLSVPKCAGLQSLSFINMVFREYGGTYLISFYVKIFS